MTRRRRQTLVAVASVLAIAASLGAAVTLTGARAPSELEEQRPELGEGEGELQEREEWFYGQRAYPGGSIPAGAYASAREQADKVAPTDAVTPTDLEWEELGPHSITSYTSNYFTNYPYYGSPPLAGRVSAIATHPTDADTAYVGGATGGVWKTTNGGQTWTPLFDQQAAAIAVGAIAIDPVTPATVYAGTGEANFGYGSYFGTGVYKSTNGGTDWAKLNGSVFDNCYVSDIVVKPGDSDTVLVAVHEYSGKKQTVCLRGVYRSTNATTATPTWTRETSRCRPTDLTVDTANPSVWYGGFVMVPGDPQGECGVYKSTDSGDNWTLSSTGLPTGRGRIALAVSGMRLYAAISDCVPGASCPTSAGDILLQGKLWTSTDGAGNWSSTPAAGDFCAYPDGQGGFDGGQCNYDLAIAVSPSDATDFYAGGIKLFKYTGGEMQAPPAVGFCDDPCTLTANDIHVDIQTLEFDASGRLWIGNDGGVYRTSDGGTFANLNTDLNLIQFYPGTSGAVAGPFVGGAQDNGVSKFAGNKTWGGLLGADGGYAAVNPNDPNVIYGTTQLLDIWKSSNGGTTVAQKEGGLPVDAQGNITEPVEFIAPLVMSPSNPAVLYAGTMRLWKTTTAAEGTNAWSAISPFFGDQNDNFGNKVSAVAQAPSDPNTIYVGTTGSVTAPGTAAQVRVTSNGGSTDPASWPNKASAPFPNRFVTDIAVHDTSASEAYVTVSGFGTGHIFKTTSSGDMWSDISGNLPNSPANAVVVDTRTSPTTIYVGTDVGVFWSAGGTTWVSANTGLPNTVVNDLVLDKQADQLIAATHGRGAFTAPVVPLPTSGSKVAFVSNRDGDYEIFVMSSNGASQTNLTKNTVEDWDPAWSPDRTKIAFTSKRDGNYEIYVMDADGGNVVRLTNNTAVDEFPTWSGDGASIAFDSNRDGDYEILKMNADGSSQTPLTTNTAIDTYPSWSPTASEIAFDSNRDGDYEILKMNADGSSQTPLTSNTVGDSEPEWSNDGTKIAFDSNRDGDSEILKMNANGSSQTPLTTNSVSDIYPSWSPNDTQLTFTSDRDGNQNIFKMASSGGAATRLTSDAGADLDPSWEPSAPSATLPGAPTNVTATAGNSQASVSWTAPVSNGGSTITNYVVTPYIGATAQTPTQVGNVTNAQITGLTNCTTYTFKVAAVNGVGTGPQSAASNAVTPQAPAGCGGNPDFGDYDGDGDSDFAIYRPAERTWYIRGVPPFVQWGEAGDIPVPGDYDGNGSTDIAVYSPDNGMWYVRGQTPAQWQQWGQPGSADIPVPADYDGNGSTDVAVYRPSTATFWVKNQFTLAIGQVGDVPVPGNYDQDLAVEPAVYRPSTRVWVIQGQADVQWGNAGDVPVPGDYNGDGQTDITTYSPADGYWWPKDQPPYVKWGGIAGDVPVPGNYNGDASDTDERTIYRRAAGFENGVWYVHGAPSLWAQWGGQANDVVLNVPPALWLQYYD